MSVVKRLAARLGIPSSIERLTRAVLAVKLGAAAAALFVLILLFAGAAATVIATQVGACEEDEPEITGSVKGVPKKYVPFYVGAAKEYKLGSEGPAILAGIHRVETNFGTLDAPGVTSGVNAYGCCSGHMQFYTAPFSPILPAKGPGSTNSSTWGQYGVDADGDGKKDPFDAEDAIYSSANYLQASGAPGDWHGAILAYNHAEWYVDDVLGYAKQFGGFEDVDIEASASSECKEPSAAGGPANLNKAIRLTEPRAYKTIPAKYMNYGAPQQIDARLYDDLVWVLEEYDLGVNALREDGHRTHGDGTGADLAPPSQSIPVWKKTAERLARDLGWNPGCTASGTAPVCPLKPAIQFVGYNGFDAAHGDPNHTGSPHIHVSWKSDCFGCGGGALVPPRNWVMAFPAPEAK